MKKSVPHLISDEEQAIKDYRDSAKETRDKKAKRTFNHIRPEEEHHKKELSELKSHIAKHMK